MSDSVFRGLLTMLFHEETHVLPVVKETWSGINEPH